MTCIKCERLAGWGHWIRAIVPCTTSTVRTRIGHRPPKVMLSGDALSGSVRSQQQLTPNIASLDECASLPSKTQ
eukprot:s1311_g14.t1